MLTEAPAIWKLWEGRPVGSVAGSRPSPVYSPGAEYLGKEEKEKAEKRQGAVKNEKFGSEWRKNQMIWRNGKEI